MIVSVDYSAIREYAKKLEKIKFRKIMKKSLQGSCATILTSMQSLTPVDTGRLRKSWHAKEITENINGVEVILEDDATDENNVTYPSFVNYGHRLRNGRWYPGRYFMEGGIRMSDAENRIKNDLLLALERELQE